MKKYKVKQKKDEIEELNKNEEEKKNKLYNNKI